MVHHYLHPLRDFIVACLVTSSCCIIHLIFKQQLVLIENEQLQAENLRNQYEVLKNQLNPHMLFNSLNTLRSLVRENQDKAQDYIQELSRVLRYTLQSNESQCVSLREEMEFVSAYIFLLKMRFENNLQFDIQINNAYEEYLLPPMAVQVLIENAVKHNEISNRKPLTIHITTDDNGNLSISNDIQPKWTATSGTGIGLANLAKRYRLLFKRDIHTGAELHIFLLDGSIYLERTIGFVHFLSDGNHDAVKGLCSHSVYTKLYRAADLYVTAHIQKQ